MILGISRLAFEGQCSLAMHEASLIIGQPRFKLRLARKKGWPYIDKHTWRPRFLWSFLKPNRIKWNPELFTSNISSLKAKGEIMASE